jgi:hypothetical protein
MSALVQTSGGARALSARSTVSTAAYFYSGIHRCWGNVPCFGSSHAFTVVSLALMVSLLGTYFFNMDMMARQ